MGYEPVTYCKLCGEPFDVYAASDERFCGGCEDVFRLWLHDLEVEVIQKEFGYEPGEFEVFPQHWRPLFDANMTPREAWQHALDSKKKGSVL